MPNDTPGSAASHTSPAQVLGATLTNRAGTKEPPAVLTSVLDDSQPTMAGATAVYTSAASDPTPPGVVWAPTGVEPPAATIPPTSTPTHASSILRTIVPPPGAARRARAAQVVQLQLANSVVINTVRSRTQIDSRADVNR
ncbi:MAG: hypothetical protein R2755_08110 [Acidimicrobiales bacterium]